MRLDYVFPLTLGFTDGIITALMITSNLLLSGVHLSYILALRISVGSASVGAFSYFIASFASNRAKLVRISKQINPSAPWKMVKGSLSNRALVDAFAGTVISASSSFAGSLIPLGIYTWSRSNVVLSISVTQASLVLLGLSLARSFRGKSFIWMTGMFSFGLAVMIIGFYVRIVS